MVSKKSVIILLAIGVVGAIIYLLQSHAFAPSKPKKEVEDTLAMVQKLTPEIAQLSEQINSSPNNAGLIFTRANAYFHYGNMKYALQDYLKAYTIDSVNAAYALGLSDCFFEVNNAPGAIQVLENYRKTDTENQDILLNLAEDYFLLPEPKYKEALDVLNSLLKVNVRNADAYFYKGLIFEELKDTTKAISNYQTCVEVDPDYYDGYMQLGLLYSEKKDKLALKYFDNALSVNDTSNEAVYAKAKFLQDNNMTIAAINSYKNIIEKNPQDDDAIYNLATLYYGLDSIQKAYTYFNLTTKIAPARALGYYGKGLCAEQMGKKEEAASLYNQALNLDPELKDAEQRLKKLNVN